MILHSFAIARLKKEPLSVTQIHVLNCVFAKRLLLLLAWLTYMAWLKTHWVFFVILASMFAFAFIVLAFHLGIGPMKKIVEGLKVKYEELKIKDKQ